jgi:hypothetical protein
LREIAAASDFDFVALEPRRPNARKRGKVQKAAAEARPSRIVALWRYRTPAFAAGLLCVLLGGIAVNAMFLQHGRHPAPLFGSTVKIEQPKPPRPPVRPSSIDALLTERIPSAPLQPVNPAQGAAFSPPAVDDQAAAAPASAPVSPAAAAPVKKTRDAIGALIAGNGVATPEASGKSVAAAQRALQKLGAPVKPDGDYGAATRKAVEAFQRDNHLPITGELNARTRRLLSARAGLPVD